MEDRLRSTSLTQWILIFMPVVLVLSLMVQYPALWIVLVAYFLGIYPILSSVIGQAIRRATEPATVSACIPSLTAMESEAKAVSPR